MSGGIFARDGDGNMVKMTVQPYDSEDILQTLLADHPDLLGSDQFGVENDRRWLLIDREARIPDEVGDTSLSVDHLFVDQDGIPTFVEVKRSSDTRIRREVVGQMLDYVSNAVTHMSVEAIRARFEAQSRFETCPAKADEALQDALGIDCSPDSFWDTVKTNLSAGKIRMLFVADEIPPMLRRIVMFLNEQMNRADVLAVEVKQYVEKDGRRKILVPRVIGQVERKRSDVISEDDFRAGISARDEDIWHGVAAFRRECEKLGGRFKPYSTGMGVYLKLGKKQSASLLYLDAGKENLLEPISGRRLTEYVKREDLDYFTQSVMDDYARQLAALGDNFKATLDSNDQYCASVGSIDAKAIKQFLDMLIAFYKEQIVPQTRQ